MDFERVLMNGSFRYHDPLTRAMNASFRVNRKPKTGRALRGVKMLWDDAYAETKELKKYRRKYVSKTKLDAVVDAIVKKKVRRNVSARHANSYPAAYTYLHSSATCIPLLFHASCKPTWTG